MQRDNSHNSTITVIAEIAANAFLKYKKVRKEVSKLIILDIT